MTSVDGSRCSVNLIHLFPTAHGSTTLSRVSYRTATPLVAPDVDLFLQLLGRDPKGSAKVEFLYSNTFEYLVSIIQRALRLITVDGYLGN